MNAAVPLRADPIDALEHALQAERQALLDHDVEALLRSTQDKIAAIRRVEVLPQGQVEATRVHALFDLNRANSILLARRRREVSWALRHIGRVESTGVYDAGGQAGARPQARMLGVG